MSFPNIFKSDLFKSTSLTAAINESETPPQRLAELGIFAERGIETTSAVIEVQGSSLQIVPALPRGADGTPMKNNTRRAISLVVPHLPVRDRLMADEVQNVRAFGSENVLQAIEQKRDEKLANINLTMANTEEYHRIGAVQGVILDADGSVIYDLFDEFGITEPDPIYFDLAAAWDTADGGRIRGLCQDVKTNIRKALKNLGAPGVVALCGDEFFKAIANHPEVRETYLAQQAANDLRGSDAREAFTYGGIQWELYPGYGNVEIPPDESRFVPRGVPGLFQTTFSPANWMSAVNTIGLPRYAMATPDQTGEKYLEIEAQMNPLHICTRPEALFKGSSAADPG